MSGFKDDVKAQLEVYGVTIVELDDMIESAPGPPLMLAMSVLSDAQHVMSDERDVPDRELARKFINRAKKILSDELLK